MENLSDRLKKLRGEKRLKQSEVAQSVGISVAAYQKYEYGNIVPKQSNEKKLADFFGVSIEYLRGETDDRGDGFEIHAHREPGTPGISLTDALDIVDRLERLTKLRDSGAITDEEFAQAKRKLLK